MGLERVISESASKLTSKTFGGVSKESAMEAIKSGKGLAKLETISKLTKQCA